ncbi:large conductance mechanosensitive channel protein MscL [Mycoplasmopsis opalescens]|uniref:large conductance mechanosensitive channel protein MscL n=1 Tax=Mycoplasmopsis opalescens TaxID=114886 RepID=UPI00068F9A43|nr:MscL family protein [Mycoplasmopsis opalescens]
MLKKASKKAWSVVKRGNMFMLAIGLLLGTVFNSVVRSLADDIIMAPITKYLKGVKLEEWKLENGMLIGKFISNLISFVIVSLFIYIGLMVIYTIFILAENRRKKKAEESNAEPVLTNEEQILNELKRINNTKTFNHGARLTANNSRAFRTRHRN